jgi:hypothetical protein
MAYLIRTLQQRQLFRRLPFPDLPNSLGGDDDLSLPSQTVPQLIRNARPHPFVNDDLARPSRIQRLPQFGVRVFGLFPREIRDLVFLSIPADDAELRPCSRLFERRHDDKRLCFCFSLVIEVGEEGEKERPFGEMPCSVGYVEVVQGVWGGLSDVGGRIERLKGGSEGRLAGEIG